MLLSAWNTVSNETIVNCLRKVGISTANQETTIGDESDPFNILLDKIDAMRNVKTDLKAEDMNAASITDFDVFAVEVFAMMHSQWKNHHLQILKF